MMQTLKICFWKYTSNDVKSSQCNILWGQKLCIQCILIFKTMYMYKCNKTIRDSANVRGYDSVIHFHVCNEILKPNL